MAEEQFTSRRARREAERQAAEQAFEARAVPEQPQEAPNSRADLLTPASPKKPETPPAPREEAGDAGTSDTGAPEAEGDHAASSRIDPAPAPRTSHARGALASDHPQESRPPVHAEDRLDPQRAPLPHFQSRAEKKRYLREHGLSHYGDLSTGALPVVADETELAERQAASEGRLTGPLPEIAEAGEDAPAESTPAKSSPTVTESAAAAVDDDASGETTTADSDASDPAFGESSESEPLAEHESYDAAGFGGATEEVAARDFEAPVTADSAPRPTSRESEPYDALSMPFSALDEDAVDESPTTPGTDAPAAGSTETPAPGSTDAAASGETDGADSAAEALGSEEPAAKDEPTEKTEVGQSEQDGPEPASRSRRMPIVQPPSTSGVRVVTAASAQIPTTDEPGTAEEPTAASAGTETASADDATNREANTPAHEPGSDDAARALAANPETRPMDAVPEAWALPNSDYEDEETENPPGTRIPARSVTGHDGQILMGEEPSKMPYIILGIAAFFALALIVVAFIMFQ